MRFLPRHRQMSSVGRVILIILTLGVAEAQGQSAEDLQRELQDMKRQMQQLQERMKKQEELIQKLKAAPATPPLAAAALPAAEATPPAKSQEEIERELTEKIMRRIQPSLSAANKTFPSQFNPAIGFIVDTVGSYKEHPGANFEFRSGELGLSASVDPFVRGYAIINGTENGIDVEEAAIVTTSLPYNLTLKGGRFFTEFGRLSKFHDHDLPFVNRPIVLDNYVGGESQGDGVELSYLTPLSQYLTFTLGAYNKIGADNTQVDNGFGRPLSRFTYLFRPATFISLTDANSIDLGATYAYTPKVQTYDQEDVGQLGDGKARHLAGLDLTYRYTPLSQASYHGLIWGTELLYNNEYANVSGTDLPEGEEPLFRRRDAFGMYSYVEARLTRRYYPGFLFDFAQDRTRLEGDTKAYSPYFTVWASEFQRIRLQYTYLDAPQNHQSEFFLQWTVVMGSHVHGFRDR